jgi:GNAT superfamily N-acetyltransferase
MKGAAMLLGVTVVGRRGPFGVRGQDEEEQGNERPEQVLPTSGAVPGRSSDEADGRAAVPGFGIVAHIEVDPGVLERFLTDIGWHRLATSLQQGRFSRDLYVAVSDGGNVLGALEGHIACKEPWEQLEAPTSRVFNLGVAAGARRRGIATALMKRFERAAAAAGHRSLALSVDPHEPRDGRITFFESCGLRWLKHGDLYMGTNLPLDPHDTR